MPPDGELMASLEGYPEGLLAVPSEDGSPRIIVPQSQIKSLVLQCHEDIHHQSHVKVLYILKPLFYWDSVKRQRRERTVRREKGMSSLDQPKGTELSLNTLEVTELSLNQSSDTKLSLNLSSGTELSPIQPSGIEPLTVSPTGIEPLTVQSSDTTFRHQPQQHRWIRRNGLRVYTRAP